MLPVLKQTQHINFFFYFRLYSDYYFINPSKKSTRLTFHKAVETSKLHLENCQKMFSLRKCLYNRTEVIKFNKNVSMSVLSYNGFNVTIFF